MTIKKVIFRIGGSVEEDLRDMKEKKFKGEPDSLIVHVKKIEEIKKMMEPEKISSLIQNVEEFSEYPDEPNAAKQKKIKTNPKKGTAFPAPKKKERLHSN